MKSASNPLTAWDEYPEYWFRTRILGIYNVTSYVRIQDINEDKVRVRFYKNPNADYVSETFE
jgi:hypothetical protein